MVNLKYIGPVSGSCAPRTENIPFSADSDISRGCAIFLSANGKVSLNADSDSAFILGVTASEFKHEKDELNPESASGFLRVNVSPDSLYSVALPIFTCSAYSDNQMDVRESEHVSLGKSAVGGSLILIEKGETSDSAAKIGDIFKIDSSASSAGKLVLTISSGTENADTANLVGDKFLFLPYLGYNFFSFSDGKIQFGGESKFARVVSADANAKCANVILCNALYSI